MRLGVDQAVFSIAHISDLHITENPDERFWEVDTRASFERVFQSRELRNCDMIVISGDMAVENAEPGAYRYLRDFLDAFGKPYHVMPGNHDSPALVAEFFGLELNHGTLNRVVDGEVPMILLDTSRQEVHVNDLVFLDSALKSLAGRSPLLFLHHPLIPCGHPFMDNICFLIGREKIKKVLEQSQAARYIFCGHAHKSHTAVFSGIVHAVTPSTAVQFYSSGNDVFADHRNPGFREILVDPKTIDVDTRTIYLG